MISLECQIEANPSPSYVWYEVSIDGTTKHDYQQLSSVGRSVFGTTRKIQRIYQLPGKYAMQCQAQSRGKTAKQQFFISIHRKFTLDNLINEFHHNNIFIYSFSNFLHVRHGSIGLFSPRTNNLLIIQVQQGGFLFPF